MSVRSAMPVVDGAARSLPSAERQSWLLRGGLAFVFSYAAIEGVADPGHFDHYVPVFVRESVGATFFLGCFAVFEVLLAAAFLTGRYAYVASILGALTLLGIVVLNLDEFDVLFRNVAIAGGALALAEQTRPAPGHRRRRVPGGRGRREGPDRPTHMT